MINNMKARIATFFHQNPNPPEHAVSAFAQGLGLDLSGFHRILYQIVGEWARQPQQSNVSCPPPSHYQVAQAHPPQMVHTPPAKLPYGVGYNYQSTSGPRTGRGYGTTSGGWQNTGGIRQQNMPQAGGHSQSRSEWPPKQAAMPQQRPRPALPPSRPALPGS